MTNYENIHNMSATELAEYMDSKIKFCDGCILPSRLCRKYLRDSNCNRAWIEWLNEEVDETSLLSEKHGRLIDADELLNAIKKLESTEFYCDVDGNETSSYLLNADSVISAIETAPTVGNKYEY